MDIVRAGLRTVVIAAVVVLAGCGGSSSTSTGGSSGGSKGSSGSSASSSSAPGSSSSTASSTATSPAPLAPPLLPLFPFQTQAEADTWRAGGARQPDYTDASQTALAFARFLGYTDVDKVKDSHTDAAGAHVTLGASVPDSGSVTTAAVVHLVPYGTGAGAPWEVVGTDDTSFSITTPAYGATASSPLVVGGTITGVDESIVVHVQQLHANGTLGEAPGVPAGGTSSPWSTTVSWSAATDPIVIVSASTGGHVTSVERFTVTGLKAS